MSPPTISLLPTLLCPEVGITNAPKCLALAELRSDGGPLSGGIY